MVTSSAVPVVELGRAQALMRGDRLGTLERAAIEQIRRDARGPEGVAIGLAEPDGFDASLDHPEHIHPAHPARAHPAGPRHRAPQGRVFLGRDPGRGEIGLRLVVDRHGVVLAAFFLEPQPPALALLVVVLHAHADDGRDTRKAVDHHAQQGAIAQAWEGRRVDGVQQQPRFGWLQHRRLTRPDDVGRPAHRGGRVGGHHLPDHQPVEEAADGGQMLLDRGGAILALHLFDVGGHRDR